MATLLYNDALARRIYAGSDAFLHASRFEPCGISQMLALRYGSVPIVRRTRPSLTPFTPRPHEAYRHRLPLAEPLDLYTCMVRLTPLQRL